HVHGEESGSSPQPAREPSATSRFSCPRRFEHPVLRACHARAARRNAALYWVIPGLGIPLAHPASQGVCSSGGRCSISFLTVSTVHLKLMLFLGYLLPQNGYPLLGCVPATIRRAATLRSGR